MTSCVDVDLLLAKAEREQMYGEVVIKFENGRVVLIKESTTYKPTTYRDTRGAEGEDES